MGIDGDRKNVISCYKCYVGNRNRKKAEAMDVTTQQAAELLGVTRQSVARYISGGKLKARRHGLRVFVINQIGRAHV